MRRLLGRLGHTGIDIENIEPEMKRKIKEALSMYDQADKVYQELFCKDEEAVKLEVIKDKSAAYKKRAQWMMIKEAKEIMDNKLFQKEMREKRALARTSSADTELNKSKSLRKTRL